jgi:hypothetical protein
MTKKRKTPNPKRKVVGGPSRDPVTGYGMSSRTNLSRAMGPVRARSAISKQNTKDVLKGSLVPQYKRQDSTKANNKKKRK